MTNTKVINISLTNEQVEKIKAWADKHRFTTTGFIRLAILEKMEKDNI